MIRGPLPAGYRGMVPDFVADLHELPDPQRQAFRGRGTAAVNGEPARNRAALRNPGCLEALARHPALRRRREPPQRFARPADTPLEVRLTAIWEELFGIAPIRPDDDYFELGGDSLLAVTLMAAIEEATGHDLPLSALLETRTIQGLAALLRRVPNAPWLTRCRCVRGWASGLLPAGPCRAPRSSSTRCCGVSRRRGRSLRLRRLGSRPAAAT